MSRNPELDALKQREQNAFQRKQVAFQRYKDAKDRASAAHDIMQSAWEERCLAREEMNREFEVMQRADGNYREVWDEYGRIRDYNNSRIESLRHEAGREHEMMKSCFDQASAAYNCGNKSEAPMYASEGREHKDRRDKLNDEVKGLIKEIQNAKANAQYRAPKTNRSAFHSAKECFEGAKSRHESAQAEFQSLKTERDRLKAEFDSVQEEHVRLKEEFQRKLEGVKEDNRRERERTLDKAGVRWSEHDEAKIVKKDDGTTQIYHGGLGKGDGYGHGHTALDRFGNKTYERDAFKEHGHQNFTDDTDPALTVYPSIGQWTELRHGWIDDHKVTWCEGTGINAGQTLICDGHVDREYFDSHHDHYGPDNKYNSGKRIEDINDSLGRKKYYSGPGK